MGRSVHSSTAATLERISLALLIGILLMFVGAGLRTAIESALPTPEDAVRYQLSDAARTTFVQDYSEYRCQLVEEATYEGEAKESSSEISDMLQGTIPPHMDQLLVERGWHITFTDKETSELLEGRSVFGYCRYGDRTIQVTVKEGPSALNDLWIANTTLHEIGHAIDNECGRLSNTDEFAESISATSSANTPKGDFAIAVSKYGADELEQRFAQAFAYYAQHPDYVDSCQAFYDWFSTTVMPPMRYKATWSLDDVEWNEGDVPTERQMSSLREDFGGDSGILGMLSTDEGARVIRESGAISPVQYCDIMLSVRDYQKGIETTSRRL